MFKAPKNGTFAELSGCRDSNPERMIPNHE
jgi:hypothetical protein